MTKLRVYKSIYFEDARSHGKKKGDITLAFNPDDELYKLWYTLFIIDKAATLTPPAERIRRRLGEVLHALRTKQAKVREVGLCYAVSRDGIAWEKPDLGLCQFQNSRRNNIVKRKAHGMGVFLDRLETDSGRRYKMFGRMDDGRGDDRMVVGFSRDGLHWGTLIRCPDIRAPADTHNNAFWAATLGRYVGITRLTRRQVPRVGAVRMVGRTESRDFVHWTPADVVLEGLDDTLQMYSMPVFCLAGVYIGLPAILDVTTDRVHTELTWSPDTRTWHRICPGEPLIPTSRRKGAYDWGCAYAACPVFLAGESRLYYGGSNRGHGDWRDGSFCLATLRSDAFAGYEPKSSDKTAQITTNEITCSGRTLQISADVAPNGALRAAVVGSSGFTIKGCEPIRASVTDGPVTWKTDADLTKLVGKCIRLRFEFTKAKLYAFSFRD